MSTMKLPTVVLDTTLADLYRQAGSPYSDKRIGQVLSGFSALLQLSPNIPPNRKFIYQDSPFTSSDEPSPDQVSAAAIKYLSLVTQRDAFMCGPSPVIFFHMGSTARKKNYDQKQVIKTMLPLSDVQRPQLIFCDGPDHIPMKEMGIDVITTKVAGDSMEKYNNIVPLETHWFLNSKRALAESGLPTPNFIAITVDGFPDDAQSCCELCLGGGVDGFRIPDDCMGSRGAWLKEQSLRVYEALETHPLPFVLKNQESLGGGGTFFVRTEDERQKTIDNLRKGSLARLLSTVNETNHHLEPATMLLLDLVEDLVGDYGVTFFVNEKGRAPIFLGASKQITEGGKAWIGSIIDYSQQDELQLKFGALVVQIAEWLQSYGYIGPAGADVLEGAGDTFNVVDLNVDKRRDDFLAMFPEESEKGRLCILGWYEDEQSGSSLAEIVAGAESEESLKELVGRIKNVSNSVTF